MNKPIRLLLAEDNEDHVLLTVRALKDVEGIQLEVDTVADGKEALDYVHGVGRFEGREPPHLILLDLKMPKVSGLEVLSHLKEDSELRSIPIVILSASDRPEDIDTSYKMGANSFVTKPIGVGAHREGVNQIRKYWTEVGSLPESSR